MDKKINIGVGLIIVNDKRQALMGLRKNNYGKGTWGFVGGKMEFGESFEQTAVRECYEEVGIVLEPDQIKILDVTNDVNPDLSDHYVTIFACCYLVGRVEYSLMEPDKCEKWEWIDLDKMPTDLFLPIIHFMEKNDLIKV